MSFRKLGFSEASLLLKRFLLFLFGLFSIEMFSNLSNDRLYLPLNHFKKDHFSNFIDQRRKLINWLNIFEEQFRNIQNNNRFVNSSISQKIALSIFNNKKNPISWMLEKFNFFNFNLEVTSSSCTWLYFKYI